MGEYDGVAYKAVLITEFPSKHDVLVREKQ